MDLNHQKRKRPCKSIENKVIEEKVQEKLQELSKNNNIKIENLISNNNNITMDIQNKDGLVYLSTIDNNSIDLVLTDPPYITSKKTGMSNLYKQIKENRFDLI